MSASFARQDATAQHRQHQRDSDQHGGHQVEIGRLQAERILFQLILAGALLVAISFFSDSVPGWIGWLVIVVAVVVWKLLYLLGRWLRGQQVLPETARFALKLLIALLIGIGIWTCYTTIVGLWRGP